MTINVQTVLVAVQALGLPALVLFYLRDRRKNRVETTVAEATAQDRVDLSSISAVEAHVALVEKAFDAERASMGRQIAELERRLVASQAEGDQQRAELETMRNELERLRSQVDTLADELQAASLRIESLLNDRQEHWG